MPTKVVLLLSLMTSAAFASPVSILKRAETIEFDYEGNSGPNFWPDGCQKAGPGQSPIDLRDGSADIQTGSLSANLVPQEKPVVFNSGHDLRVELDPASPKASFIPAGQSESYQVSGFHVHAPSEHHMNGMYFDAEMHIVGKTPDNKISVLAVMFQVSESPQEGNFLSLLTENLPLNGKRVPLPQIDFSSVLSATKNLTGFRTYTGSLTTPPCSLGVLWNVMETPVPIGVNQVIALRKEIGYSARFTQVARDEKPVFTPPKKLESRDYGKFANERVAEPAVQPENPADCPEPEPAVTPEPVTENAVPPVEPLVDPVVEEPVPVVDQPQPTDCPDPEVEVPPAVEFNVPPPAEAQVLPPPPKEEVPDCPEPQPTPEVNVPPPVIAQALPPPPEVAVPPPQPVDEVPDCPDPESTPEVNVPPPVETEIPPPAEATIPPEDPDCPDPQPTPVEVTVPPPAEATIPPEDPDCPDPQPTPVEVEVPPPAETEVAPPAEVNVPPQEDCPDIQAISPPAKAEKATYF